MNENHKMEHKGSGLFVCHACGRMIQIDNDPPGMRVLVKGNRHARHSGSTGGLVISAEVRQSDPWDELLDKMNFEELWREP